MRPQFIVQKDVESVYLEADIPVFVASLVCSCDLGLVSDAGLYDYIFNSVHDLFKIDSVLAKPVAQLIEIPFGGVLAVIILSGAAFDVVIRFLVHRVIGKMDKSLF